jgi:uncharacterized protein YijF (DUF1287 family)|tara:strand:+ start:7618 stop:8172 length:555 start_codon:yes stop_codon:yes gene_type:complete
MIKIILLLSMCYGFVDFDVFVAHAVKQTYSHVKYDGNYYEIDYPNGDIPRDIGVCTDVIIRAYRDCCGIDLQQLVYEDMINNNHLYDTPYEVDNNIDHRRVKHLRVFFENNGYSKPITGRFDAEYNPGDIITWNLRDGTLPHIGIVSHIHTINGTPLIIHNGGNGVVIEDILFKFEITGHYKYE